MAVIATDRAIDFRRHAPTPRPRAERGRSADATSVPGSKAIKTRIGRFAVDPLGNGPLRHSMVVHSDTQINLLSVTTTALRAQRLADCHTDGEPRLAVLFTGGGTLLRLDQYGRKYAVPGGDAALVALYDPLVCVLPTGGVVDVLVIPRRFAATRIADVEAAVARPVSNRAALALLSHYLAALRLGPMADPRLASGVMAHICDLAALAFSPSGAPSSDALDSVAAARLATIKRHVAQRLTDPGLQADGVARHFGITDRYLRKLFEPEGGFHDHVVRGRIAIAQTMLSDPAMTDIKILDIAYRCGFNSVSSFNRSFARIYGSSPSSLR